MRDFLTDACVFECVFVSAVGLAVAAVKHGQ